ncbi:hypothetical protein V2W45_1256561, partial [Cenococcum geophilum]
ILDDLVNSLAKECDYSDNAKDGEVIDKGNAENCNYGSDDSGNTDNDNAGDGDSSDGDSSDGNSSNSDEGNEAYGCIGQRGSLAPIGGELKLKRAAKHCL